MHPTDLIIERLGVDVSSRFRAPMSMFGREVMNEAVYYVVGHGIRFGGPAKIVQALLDHGYSHYFYEEVVMGWNHIAVASMIRNWPKNTRGSLETILDIGLLKPIHKGQWTPKIKGKDARLRTGMRFSGQMIDIYEHVSAKYLVQDFNQYDLMKLVDICRTYTLQQVREASDGVQEASKRTIPYLYAILKSEASTEVRKTKAVVQLQAESVAKVDGIMAHQIKPESKPVIVTNWADDQEDS